MFRKGFRFNKLEVMNLFMNSYVKKGVVFSWIGEVEIEFNVKILGEIMGIFGNGFFEYGRDDWFYVDEKIVFLDYI